MAEKISKNKKAKIKKVYKHIITALSLLLLIFIIINIGDKQKIKIAEISIKEYNSLTGNEEQIMQGQVIVKYVDTEGNSLQEDTILTGNVGEIYTTTRAEISAYKAYGKDPINKIGNYDEKQVTVTYVYTRKTDNVNINNADNVVTVQILNEQQTTIPEIRMSIVAQNENGEKITGGKYTVKDGNNLIIREATSYIEKLLVGSIQLTEEGTEKYYITESKNPEGYEVLEDIIEVEVELTEAINASNAYDVTANVLKPNENVVVTVENDEIIITINYEKQQVKEPEIYPQPQPQPKPEPKLFDLQITNSIIDIEVATAESKEKYTKKSEQDIIKVDLPKSEIENIEIEATYKIVITNIGELAGYAKEITNVIPKGMELVEYNSWVKDGNMAKNTELEETLLNPGESAILFMKLRWTPSETNIGVKLDKSIISNSISEQDTKDCNSANDEAIESFVISIRTGYSNYIYIVEIILVVLIIATVIVANLRRKE